MVRWRQLRKGTAWSIGAAMALVLTTVGCSITVPKDEASQFYAIPVGSKIILNRDLEVSPRRARVYIQDGSVVQSADPFAPQCNFEVEDVEPFPQTIQKDEFVVRKVSRDWRNVVVDQHIQLVSRSGMGSGTSDIFRIWHLWLASDKQPNVRKLLCSGVYAEPYRARTPSIQEIRATLGDIATLRLQTSN